MFVGRRHNDLRLACVQGLRLPQPPALYRLFQWAATRFRVLTPPNQAGWTSPAAPASKENLHATCWRNATNASTENNCKEERRD